MSESMTSLKESMMDSKEHLSKSLRQGADVAMNTMGDELEKLSERVEALSTDVRRRLHTMDQHVHEKPYLYLLGVGLLGVGAGFLFKSRATAKN